MNTCPKCGFSHQSDRVISRHINTHSEDFANTADLLKFKLDVKFGKNRVDEMLAKYINCEISLYETNMAGFGELLIALGIKRSSSEERKTPRYQNKYKAAIKEKYGVENISQNHTVQRKKEETYAKKYGSYEEYLRQHREYMDVGLAAYIGTESHKEATIKGQETCYDRYGHCNFGAGELAKEKRKTSHAATVATWSHEERLLRTDMARKAVCSRGGGLSKPEKMVRKALTELGISFSPNVHMFSYNYDMVFDNIIIEVQGDMWHGHPDTYKPTDKIMGKKLVKDIWKKDADKKEIAEKNGFSVIAIWERDIVKKTEQELMKLINQLLTEVNYEQNKNS